ncbi:uncharacterized protein LOC124456011 isoform X2 [Xenia sp. Carnegie-2017]|uniref:uncharacterized protein LOC124456011 isoform X2 n=1 Tax=Xenia sp. Carnegie-2017 TaxID=2897299 RepID=UPI001F0390DB|nr:uncharacterized protein LOC124456011 isoform X2 [Xenia sp. Carnegie-2017]
MRTIFLRVFIFFRSLQHQKFEARQSINRAQSLSTMLSTFLNIYREVWLGEWKKFRRSNDFFYNNVERKGNTQKDDANEQSEDIAENYDKHQELTTKTQDSEDIFTKQSISIITEEPKQPCQHSQSHLSPTGHYTGLLLQFDFASNVSHQQSFVVHDYNANKRTIMHNSFVFVHRYPHLLLDGYGWILCCSCDANRKQFVDALPNNIQLDPQKDIPYPSCIHILAMEKYLVVYDRKFGIEAKDFIEKKSTSMMQSVFSDHSYHEMQPEEDLFSAVCREVQWIAVKPVNSPWGVCTLVYSKVMPPQPELKCCSYSSYHCIHVTTLAKAMQIVDEDEMDSPLALF